MFSCDSDSSALPSLTAFCCSIISCLVSVYVVRYLLLCCCCYCQALQRHLPRPVSLDQLPAPQHPAQAAQLSYREAAEQELLSELTAVLQHDAARYPIKDKKDKKDKRAAPTAMGAEGPPLQQFELAELEHAAELVRSETDFVINAMGHASVSHQDYMDAWATVSKDLTWLPSQGKYGRAASATNQERLESIRAEFEAVRSLMEKEAVRAHKLEKKANVVIQGLQQRDVKLASQVADMAEQLQNAKIELVCFQALRAQEVRSAPERLERLHAAADEQQRRESDLQDKYKLLTQQRGDLLDQLRHHAKAAAVHAS